MKLVTIPEMQAVEREANAAGFTYAMMMENAGTNLAEVIEEEYGYLAERGVLGLIGSGNNGGDALVALAWLAQQGWQAGAYIVRPRPDDDPLILRLAQAGGDIYLIQEDEDLEKLTALIEAHELLLDGVLGTGIRLPLKDDLAQVLNFVRAKILDMEEPPSVIAVDCPSGIDCDSGEAAPETIPAEMTVTMAAVKQGLLKFPAFDLAGELRLVGIGLPQDGETLQAWRAVRCEIIEDDWVRRALPPRPNNAHKGTFGTALIAAGSVNYTGAALLAGQAAYRAGAGLVTLAIPEPLYPALAGQFPEATWLILPDETGVIAEAAANVIWDNLSRATALLLGPGIGQEEPTELFLSQLLAVQPKPASGKMGLIPLAAGNARPAQASLPPLVIDADGLKLLARLPDWPKRLPAPAILTPHPGEMAFLTGLPTAAIQSDRLNLARKYSAEWGHIVVLKGAFTIIAEPGGASAVIPIATPALARAGTGDVLAGVIVGLRAQGVEAFKAAAAGAWIHAQAGILAEQRLGNPASVLAGDVLHSTIDVITQLQ